MMDNEQMENSLSGVNLNRLVVFAAVVEAGSFTAAAARLGLAKTMVSTHIQRLESEVGASLIVRSTRSLRLTDTGEVFHAAVRGIVQDLDRALEAVGQTTQEPRGTLRIAAPVDYGAAVIAPLAVQLRTRHPDLRIDLRVSDQVVDLIGEGIDVAIRIGRLGDSGLKAVRLGTIEECLVASPGWLRRQAPVREPIELARLPFISMSALRRPLTWRFDGPERQRCTVTFDAGIRASASLAVRTAALAGGGLAILPDYAVDDDVRRGRLVRVLPEWRLPAGGIHAVFPASRHRPPKVHALLDALRTALAQPAARDAAGSKVR